MSDTADIFSSSRSRRSSVSSVAVQLESSHTFVLLDEAQTNFLLSSLFLLFSLYMKELEVGQSCNQLFQNRDDLNMRGIVLEQTQERVLVQVLLAEMHSRVTIPY